MNADELRARTKQFAIRIVRLFQALPLTTEAQIIGKQLLRSGTSLAANYRAACRARSRAEFISKLAVVIEEADETVFWLELLVESSILPERRISELLREGNELLSIIAASRVTAQRRTKS
ncbi:MAG: four helix bundle protein [Candidatus Korobacteraceae bacterium]